MRTDRPWQETSAAAANRTRKNFTSAIGQAVSGWLTGTLDSWNGRAPTMAKITAALECGHLVTIDHRKKEPESYCRFHGVQPITERWETEWRIMCLTCRFSRWCGSGVYANGEATAKREANSHCYWKRGSGTTHHVHKWEDSRIKPMTRKMLEKSLTPPIGDATFDLFATEQPPPF